MGAEDLHNLSKGDHSTLTSTDTMISTWSNGKLIESSSTKILLPEFIMENEEKFSNELSNSQNFIADSNQVSSFVKSFLQKDSKRYSRLFQMCTVEEQSTEESVCQLKFLLTLNSYSFPSNAVLPWQKPTSDATKVQIIHGKRREFLVPNESPYSLTGSLCEYLKDPE